MDATSFTNPSGELVKTMEDAWAFIPAPLPPAVNMAEIALNLAQAMNAIGELKGAAKRLTNPYLLVQPLQRREALTSSAMEGTYTTVDALILDEAGITHSSTDDTREVSNYIRAMRHATTTLASLPLSGRLIKEAHAILLSGLSSARGSNKLPGQYKRNQNMIGGRDIRTARYVPPPPGDTDEAMGHLEAYINRADSNSGERLIDLALVHYQFEAIHPFADGNGRIGRMLITLMAMQNGLLDAPILYLSPRLENHKDEYIDLMHNVSTRSEWSPWINFFLRHLEEACNDAIGTINDLINLHQSFQEKARNAGRSSRLIEIVDMLFETPVTTIPRVQDRLSVTYAAARQLVAKLVEAGILREVDSHPKYFVADEIFRICRPASHE